MIIFIQCLRAHIYVNCVCRYIYRLTEFPAYLFHWEIESAAFTRPTGLPDCLGTRYQKWQIYTKYHKIYKMSIKYTKSPWNRPNVHKICQHLPLQDCPKFKQLSIFGLKMHLPSGNPGQSLSPRYGAWFKREVSQAECDPKCLGIDAQSVFKFTLHWTIWGNILLE
jgi:hypothetical protein